ncbi:T-cell surface glycoprotein CD3 epsilon chain-like [Hippoglossus hippoglossus]|uniref:T-cell surface glycoprotein CD3 epsilon chain-like n=1 Tax=Hippoglossus hippoglossus TaxID=8267 RepID=UPI00148E42D7|nr:T-cell surface glycoprotein CD3 epsilon chain-like [Hippoglossus hippoglossus]
MKIHSMGVRAVIAMTLLLSLAASEEETAKGSVKFKGGNFTMTCPVYGKWYRRSAQVGDGEEHDSLELNYNSDTKGLYKCVYKDNEEDKEYYFYVKGKACANCIELEAAPLALAITVDMAGTIILMMIIYKCTKKKSSAGSTQASKAPARAGGRAPPVPSPDYEALNPHTRSQDPYAIVSRTG